MIGVQRLACLSKRQSCSLRHMVDNLIEDLSWYAEQWRCQPIARSSLIFVMLTVFNAGDSPVALLIFVLSAIDRNKVMDVVV